MRHGLSVHLESFAFSCNPRIYGLSVEEKKALDAGRIVDQVDRLLSLLREYDQKITFFVVSMIHDWYPELVERMAGEGHEIGWHGHTHGLLAEAQVLERELEAAGRFLDAYHPRGFCPPEFSFASDHHATLQQAGFRYTNSSLGSFVRRSVGGMPEFPVSTFRWRRRDRGAESLMYRGISFGMLLEELPYGSSFLLPLLGGKATVGLVRKGERASRPSNLFFHNWQVFAEGEEADRDRRWYFRRNPLYFPYLLNIERPLRHVLEHVRFDTLENVFLLVSANADQG